MAAVAVLFRETAEEDWQFHSWAVSLDVGTSTAKFNVYHEAWDGNSTFQAKVISEKDADAKRFDVPGLANFQAGNFKSRQPSDALRIRVAPKPSPLARPAPLALRPRPLKIKVQK